jgi:hypothetical protein
LPRRTVFIHVGIAKTGTTYLQRILFANREQLKAAGLLYPGKRSGDHYIASVDLRKLDNTEKFEHLRYNGMWDRLAEEVRGFEGNAVISHETFARCSTAEIKRVVASLGDVDLRVVLTVRDLARQVPAVWQETLKNRQGNSYDEFLADVFVNVDSGEHKFFWKAQDVRKVVSRWGRQVGMDNVTVVTVPPTGARKDELWKRFSTAIELPDVAVKLPSAASNTSLGPAEAELLRYVNLALPPAMKWQRYGRLIKRQLAEQRLARRPSSRISVPEQWHQTVQARGQSITRYLRRTGCRVVGDLADLRPQLSPVTVAGPDDLSREEILTVAGEVIRDLVLSPPRRRRSADDEDAPNAVARLRAVAVRARALAGRSRARLFRAGR